MFDLLTVFLLELLDVHECLLQVGFFLITSSKTQYHSAKPNISQQNPISVS